MYSYQKEHIFFKSKSHLLFLQNLPFWITLKAKSAYEVKKKKKNSSYACLRLTFIIQILFHGERSLNAHYDVEEKKKMKLTVHGPAGVTDHTV